MSNQVDYSMGNNGLAVSTINYESFKQLNDSNKNNPMLTEIKVLEVKDGIVVVQIANVPQPQQKELKRFIVEIGQGRYWKVTNLSALSQYIDSFGNWYTKQIQQRQQVVAKIEKLAENYEDGLVKALKNHPKLKSYPYSGTIDICRNALQRLDIDELNKVIDQVASEYKQKMKIDKQNQKDFDIVCNIVLTKKGLNQPEQGMKYQALYYVNRLILPTKPGSIDYVIKTTLEKYLRDTFCTGIREGSGSLVNAEKGLLYSWAQSYHHDGITMGEEGLESDKGEYLIAFSDNQCHIIDEGGTLVVSKDFFMKYFGRYGKPLSFSKRDIGKTEGYNVFCAELENKSTFIGSLERNAYYTMYNRLLRSIRNY